MTPKSHQKSKIGGHFYKMCTYDPMFSSSTTPGHNPPLAGLPVHALPILNHDQTDHNTKPMEHWCIATVA